MADPYASAIVVDSLPPLRRSRRIALVTETYPPEVNGVAMSVARIVDGLHRRQHEIQLVRPRQGGSMPQPAASDDERFEEVLTAGWPIPAYPELRMGAPSKRALVRLWSVQRPDVVHIATEGPLGWSALQAALHLKLPVTSDFRTNFHTYGRHYRIGWLARPISAYLRKFHNRAHATMVPTDALRAQLARPASSACMSWGAAWTPDCSTRRGAATPCAAPGVRRRPTSCWPTWAAWPPRRTWTR